MDKWADEDKMVAALHREVRDAPEALNTTVVRQLNRVLSTRKLETNVEDGECQELSEVKVLVGSQQYTWYVFGMHYMDRDGGDGWYNVFEDQTIATEVYLDYVEPHKRQKRAGMPVNRFTYLPYPSFAGEVPVIVGTLYNNVICEVRATGSGSRYREYPIPYFNSKKLSNEQIDELQKLKCNLPIDEIHKIVWSRTDFMAASYIIGDNGYGISIEHDPIVLFQTHNCQKTSLEYFELRTRISNEAFAALCNEAGLFFHKEEGAWEGWCTNAFDDATAVLARFEMQPSKRPAPVLPLSKYFFGIQFDAIRETPLDDLFIPYIIH